LPKLDQDLLTRYERNHKGGTGRGK